MSVTFDVSGSCEFVAAAVNIAIAYQPPEGSATMGSFSNDYFSFVNSLVIACELRSFYLSSLFTTITAFDNGSANDARDQSLLRRIKHFLAVSSKSLGENAEKKTCLS